MGRPFAFGLLLTVLGCSDGYSPVKPPPPTPAATPPPSAPPGVVIGAATGPTQIIFSASQPPPGAIFTGCGPDLRGCEGRLRLRFLLRPTLSGHALRFSVSLHDTTQRACLFTSTEGFDLRAGDATAFDLVLNQSDRCVMPATISSMAAVVEGVVEVASRQEWGVTYTLRAE
jgi:hypothetical protein